MSRRLPSLNALRTFEATARLGRMTAAADELCVTHGAVSRQVRALQEELGVALFEGPKHALQLTPAGQTLLPILTQAFDQIAAAVAVVSSSTEHVLNVSCLSTFTMRWLIPRLHLFHETHPGIDVRLSTTSHAVQIERERYDVVINVDQPEPSGAPAVTSVAASAVTQHSTCTLLFDEWLGPVLSPELMGKLARGGRHHRLALLRQCPRLQTRTRPRAWQEWAAACRAKLPAAPQQEFAHYTYTLEAALGGLGLCVAPWHLVAADVASGRLIAPLGFVSSGLQYTARCRADHTQAALFCQWLQQEAEHMPAAPSAS
ncbi:MAG: LysR substrate-binding domain-containing protein [Burkholderiales bacterium]